MSKLKVNVIPAVSRGALLAIQNDFNLTAEVYLQDGSPSPVMFRPDSAYWVYDGATDWQPVIDRITEYNLPSTTEII
jgi:hypothetical protein